jgi:nucleoside-diphosphate-sugar epimerase
MPAEPSPKATDLQLQPVGGPPTEEFFHNEVTKTDLEGFEAVVRLAALSNDPLGNLDPGLTYIINHKASVRLAELSKQAGVRRLVFSSSCSTYGASADGFLDETAELNPVEPGLGGSEPTN